MRALRRLRRAAVGALLVLSALATGAIPAGAVAQAPPAEPAPLQPAPTVARLAYLTQTATSEAKVWIASASGGERKLLGLGQQPLLAPNGASVAVSLFGASPGIEQSGPAIGIYPATGGPTDNFLNLETSIATPLAWSPDSRYLAVLVQSNEGLTAADTSLEVIDTQAGTVSAIAHGVIYGASFARDGSDRIVFALAHSLSPSAASNLYVSEASGASLQRITSDGRSLDPVWGPRYIAYDRERNRKLSPEFQIWLASASGVRVRKLTHVAVGSLVQGLVPLQFSASGSRLVAEFEGEDTSAAYTVNVATGQARAVTNSRGRSVQAAGISSDGSTLLVDENAFEQPPSNGRVASVPFAGGRPTVLVAHASQASWNR
jgi:Tol biopolymer transport system component